MGTDIHCQLEYKKNGKWYWALANLPEELDRESFNPLNFNRSYNLFAILANVRNGYGFAGCDTGDEYNPISEPKGLPEDISEELKKYHEENEILGDHDFSYLTKDELENYDWEQKITNRGWVGIDQYKVFKEKGKPESWSGGVSGSMVEHLTNKEMENIIEGKTLTIENMRYVTNVEWEETYIQSVPWDYYFKLTTLEYFLNWDKKEEIENVRIVFGFDS